MEASYDNTRQYLVRAHINCSYRTQNCINSISKLKVQLNTSRLRYRCPRLIIVPMSLNSSMTGLLVTNYPYSYQILATLFFGGMLLFGRLNFKRRNPNGLPLPPGPKGLPLVRNLFDFPNNKQWLVFDEWQKTYGKYFITQMHLLRISGNSRRYGLLQCSRPALFAFGLPATDNRPLREKVFKLL